MPEFIIMNLRLHTERNLPATQSGGVAGGGTGFPNHSLGKLVDYANMT